MPKRMIEVFNTNDRRILELPDDKRNYWMHRRRELEKRKRVKKDIAHRANASSLDNPQKRETI